MRNFGIKEIYFNPIFARFFHTLVNCLQKELADCESVLDLGCGPDSPLQFCKNVKYSVGVEVFKPYLLKSKKKNIHKKYMRKKIEEIEFPEKRFDAVILLEVLEHLTERQSKIILKKAEKWAKKKVIISSPNGFVPQKEVDDNPFQKHLSGWDYQKMKRNGYCCHGLAGLKILRQEVQNSTMGSDLLTTIRFQPKPFWFLVATLSQIPVYFFPSFAFEIFSVKKLK